MIRVLIGILFPLWLFAAPFYDQAERGWHWYDDPTAEQGQEAMTVETAQIRLAEIKKELQGKKALAVIDPTEGHIKDYIRVQNAVNQRAEIFSTLWQKVIMQNPELDHTLKNPTNAVARRVYHEEKQIHNQTQIKSFAQQYGLFFFFRSNCPYCHQFSPILKLFEQTYGITVVPVSLDGQGLPEYPSPRFNNGIAEKLNIDVVPALIAVDPQSGEVVPVSYGLVTVDELTYRMTLLSQIDDRGAAQ